VNWYCGSTPMLPLASTFMFTCTGAEPPTVPVMVWVEFAGMLTVVFMPPLIVTRSDVSPVTKVIRAAPGSARKRK
jgi:hypothetical protein